MMFFYWVGFQLAFTVGVISERRGGTEGMHSLKCAMLVIAEGQVVLRFCRPMLNV
jgi:hypothetical protein